MAIYEGSGAYIITSIQHNEKQVFIRSITGTFMSRN